jgi:FRG domain.
MKDEVEKIEKVSDLITKSNYFRTRLEGSITNLFYRGHSYSSFKLLPAIYRHKQYEVYEDRMFEEMVQRNPQEFDSDLTTFDKLARMQHHGLPTRLLDITSNPLVALYFAVETQNNEDGAVIISAIENRFIRFSDDKLVNCISNLARLSGSEKFKLNLSFLEDEITCEEPSVLKFIDLCIPVSPERLFKMKNLDVVCVKPKLSNKRIYAQSGAFLLFGDNINCVDGQLGEHIFCKKYIVPSKKKTSILEELHSLNINRNTLFPSLETSAKDIADFYLKNS